VFHPINEVTLRRAAGLVLGWVTASSTCLSGWG